jgi:predicted dehydrogenase
MMVQKAPSPAPHSSTGGIPVGIKIGMVGVGAFAQSFIPLFKAHPLVDCVVLCDLDADKLQRNAAQHNIPDTCPSLDALCQTDVDAVAIITQHWMHAPQAVQALRAGKHVYSAVPAGVTADEVFALVRAVEETGRIYMMGETSYYYPNVIYCREQYAKGAFGRVVYAEAEYLHDWDHGLYDVAKWRGGERWMELAGGPPMHYPTHSVSQIVSVTGAYMTHVSCQGFVDQHEDGIYQADANIWHNTFSNESALFRMSDGSAARINEFRRVGHPGGERMSMWGTQGSFELNAAGAAWVTKERGPVQRLDEIMDLKGVSVDGGTFAGVSSAHPVQRLPREFIGLPNGHWGSHQFLVDDFVTACVTGQHPPVDVWQAARYTLPGIIAHESAVRGGELLDVPFVGPAVSRSL